MSRRPRLEGEPHPRPLPGGSSAGTRREGRGRKARVGEGGETPASLRTRGGETPPPAPPRRKLRWHTQGGEKEKDPAWGGGQGSPAAMSLASAHTSLTQSSGSFFEGVFIASRSLRRANLKASARAARHRPSVSASRWLRKAASLKSCRAASGVQPAAWADSASVSPSAKAVAKASSCCVQALPVITGGKIMHWRVQVSAG